MTKQQKGCGQIVFSSENKPVVQSKDAVVGFGRRTFAHEDFRKYCSNALQEYLPDGIDTSTRDWLIGRLYFRSGGFDEAATFGPLKDLLQKVDGKRKTGGNYLFYPATAPEFFRDIIRELKAVNLVMETDAHWRRAVFEKPFGHYLASAKALNKELLELLQEKQIYRIDHYLGKETVQDILGLRFGNGNSRQKCAHTCCHEGVSSPPQFRFCESIPAEVPQEAFAEVR